MDNVPFHAMLVDNFPKMNSQKAVVEVVEKLKRSIFITKKAVQTE